MDDATLKRLLAEATPGPWCIASAPLLRIVKADKDRPVVLAGVHRFGCKGGKVIAGTPEANTRLIALAPDLAAEVLRLRAAAKGLADALDAVESANARVCRGRTKAAYHQIIADGQGGDLDALDDARYDARAALTAYREALP